MERDEPATMVTESDEIGEIAAGYLLEPGTVGLQRIDEQIRLANADSRWDDMSRWHRVRFRLIRLQGQRQWQLQSSAA